MSGREIDGQPHPKGDEAGTKIEPPDDADTDNGDPKDSSPTTVRRAEHSSLGGHPPVGRRGGRST